MINRWEKLSLVKSWFIFMSESMAGWIHLSRAIQVENGATKWKSLGCTQTYILWRRWRAYIVHCTDMKSYYLLFPLKAPSTWKIIFLNDSVFSLDFFIKEIRKKNLRKCSVATWNQIISFKISEIQSFKLLSSLNQCHIKL